MKVKELIEKLSRMPQGNEVFIAHHSGDYVGTIIAANIRKCEIAPVADSAMYRPLKKVLDENDDRFDHNETYERVIVIS